VREVSGMVSLAGNVILWVLEEEGWSQKILLVKEVETKTIRMNRFINKS
jgi:hypothetical protein